MFNLQPFADLINSKDCTHEYNILNFSDLEKVDKTFFKNTKCQSEKKHNFLAKEFWSQCHILRIIYMYYKCKKQENVGFHIHFSFHTDAHRIPRESMGTVANPQLICDAKHRDPLY